MNRRFLKNLCDPTPYLALIGAELVSFAIRLSKEKKENAKSCQTG